jgi:hypothetical protein
MKLRSFGGTVLFGAAAAACILVLEVVGVGPRETALALAFVAAVYVGGLATTRARRLGGFLLSWFALSAVGLALPFDVVLLGAVTTAIGLARSGFASNPKPFRALCLELGIGGLAWLMIAVFHATGLLQLPLAVWAFFLGQSGFFLVGGIREELPVCNADRFGEAHRRALRLLERSR